MFKRLIAIAMLLTVLAGTAFASVYSDSALYDPMRSVAYFGSFSDVFANPASLPLIESETGNFSIGVTLSDDWNFRTIGDESMPMLQTQNWDIQASFLATYVALTASFGTAFERQSSDPLYNVYSSLGIQLDVAYAFPFFSIGISVSGGNRMSRNEETIDSFPDIFANAWFSPFKRDAGSEFFDLGVGAIFHYGFFSVGAYIGELLTLSDVGDIYMGWDAIGRSTTFSIAFSASRYLSNDDLRFLRPRASVSVTGIGTDTSTVEAEVELRLQFLPDADLSFALSYFETDFTFFNFNRENGYVAFFIRGGGMGFSGTLGLIFSAADGAKVSPVIGFSYIN